MDTRTYEPAGYDIDLGDAKWELLKSLIYAPQVRLGRERRREPDSARANLDAIRYVLKTGCRWSLLPKQLIRCVLLAGSLRLAASPRSATTQMHGA